MTAITLNAALDQAVEKLRPLHKRVFKLRLRNKTYRTRVLDELSIKLHEDVECCALQLEGDASIQSLLSEGNPETIFSFDPENLAKFLEIIIKYLPQLLAILLPLFASLLLPFLLLLPSTATAQCVNCQVPTLAPQLTQTVLLSPQEVSVETRRLPVLDAMSVRVQGRQEARATRAAHRSTSVARYPSVSATYSAGSVGTTTSYGSTGTPTYSLGSVGTPQAVYSSPPQAVYSLGSTGTYSTPVPSVTYSLGSVGTPTPVACACVNCNCAPTCACAPAASTAAPCINCAPAAPITYSAPAPIRSVSYSPVYSPARSSNYMIALRSATERARLGIKGHLSSIERQAGRSVGVGWSSSNPNPTTCFNNRAGDYVSIRGRDGWYATKIVY